MSSRSTLTLPFDNAASLERSIALPLAVALQRFANNGFAPLLPDYAARDLLRGQAVSTSATPPLQGQALGVAGDGTLRVQAADGVLHRVHSGEVSVRLQGHLQAPEAVGRT